MISAKNKKKKNQNPTLSWHSSQANKSTIQLKMITQDMYTIKSSVKSYQTMKTKFSDEVLITFPVAWAEAYSSIKSQGGDLGMD